MKRKMVLGTILIVLLILQAQMVFAGEMDKHEMDFVRAFERSDLTAMERVLKENRNKHNDISVLLYTVFQNYYVENNNYITSINRDKRLVPDIIQMFSKIGTDFNIVPGYYYAKDRSDNTIGYFYNKDVDYTKTVLQLAIELNMNTQVIRLLLEAGADMYKARGSYKPSINGDSVFPYEDDYIAIAKVLIEYGFNVNRPVNGAGWYPLHMAVYERQIGIVKLLVESGAKVNQLTQSNRTAAEMAYVEFKEIDIYNYLKQNGAVWSPPGQVASTPPPSTSQSRPSYNDNYDYTPPPSSSGNSSSSSRSSGVELGKSIAEAFSSPIDSGTYGLSGTQAKIRLTSIAKSGMLTYTNKQGKTVSGYYSIDGNRMTVQADGYTYVYTITSKTSFSGHGENWVRTGY